jgi:hypothetical protein
MQQLIFFSIFAALAMVFFPVAAENVQLDSDIIHFQMKCSQCHQFDRIIEKEIVIPTEVEETVDRMSEKPGAKIQPDDKKRIVQAILYNIYVNKLDVLKKKLDELPPEEKKQEVEILKEALKPYQK